MRLRRCMVVPLAIAGALGGAVAMGAPAALAGSDQAPSTPQTHPSVRPRIGRRHSTFELTFTLAQAPGFSAYYREVVSRPAHAGAACSPAQPAPVLSGRQGARIKIPLRPTAHGWCKGRYAVTIFLQRTHLCGPPLAHRALIPCPVTPAAERAFPVETLNTGHTHFTVR